VSRALAVVRPWRADCFITVGDEPLVSQPFSVPGAGFSQVPLISQIAGLPWLVGVRQPPTSTGIAEASPAKPGPGR
jgi:hypothetical protein